MKVSTYKIAIYKSNLCELDTTIAIAINIGVPTWKIRFIEQQNK